jgi:LPXTG-site transpeptidase (sortase) family protein
MKRGASIALSLVVGALVTSAFLARTSSGSPTSPTTAAQAVVQKPARTTVVPRRRPRRLEPRRTPDLINIPRLHLKSEIGTDLDRGPAWWPVTGRPGGGDTIAIAGHRTTHTRPFYWLERVRAGDRIYVRWQGHTHAYRMSGRRILSARNMHIANARGHELLLLTACTPRGSARQRIVVYAWPIENPE